MMLLSKSKTNTSSICAKQTGDECSKHSLLVDFPSSSRRKSFKDSKAKKVQISPKSTLHCWVESCEEVDERVSNWHCKHNFDAFSRAMKFDAAKKRHETDDLQLELLSLVGDATTGEANVDSTTRGIEHLLHKPTLEKLIFGRSKHREAVLREHWHQREIGVYDPAALRHASRMHSKWMRRRALVMAGGKSHAGDVTAHAA